MRSYNFNAGPAAIDVSRYGVIYAGAQKNIDPAGPDEAVHALVNYMNEFSEGRGA